MSVLRVGNSEAPSAVRTYCQLRERRICDMLGLWVSELEPVIFERVDVSPQILVEVGIGIEGGLPQITSRVTVDEMIAAGAIGGPTRLHETAAAAVEHATAVEGASATAGASAYPEGEPA